MGDGVPVLLTPKQSVTIHGWLNPKRMLSWKDIRADSRITPELCHGCGVDDSMLYIVQPSLQAWIDVCGVSFKDVKYMTRWPLHPFRDLHGYIPDLISNKYDAALLHKLGIDYQVLVDNSMSVEWMKMFNFSNKDWVSLCFNPSTMSDHNISLIFDTDRTTLQMMVSSHLS
jgi:hypothetical protein